MSAPGEDVASVAEVGGAAAGSTSAASTPLARARGVVSDLVELTKPRLSTMVVVTTAGGYVLAPGDADVGGLLRVVGGTAVVVASAQTLNCWVERDVDGLMERTRNRALPAGRLPPWVALTQGIVLGALSLPFLWFAVDHLSAALAAMALGSYVGIYTPLKRRTSLSTIVGAFPGALPPLIGWTAATGRIELPGLVLFGVMFLWQIPHFLALSLFLQEDYGRGGLVVLPHDGGDAFTRWSALLWVTALIPVSVLLVPLGLAGPAYGIAAMLAGAVFLGLALWGFRPGAGRRWATLLFAYSIVYLTVIFAMLAIDGRG